MIVEEALGGMEDALARDVDRLEGELERRQARLVGPRVLGGDDPVEGDAEAPVREREEVAVAVRDHAEPEPLLEPAQRGRRVVERGPLADRPGEAVGIRVGGVEAELGAEPAQRLRQDLAIGQVRAGLELGLVPRVALEQLVLACVDAARGEHRLEGVEDALLPVDQGAVAVEGDRVEAGEVDRAHAQNASNVAASLGSASTSCTSPPSIRNSSTWSSSRRRPFRSPLAR